MNAISQIWDVVSANASVMALGFVALLLTYPVQIFWTAVGIFVFLLIRTNRRLRRLQDWYLWYPIQRSLHRLYVPARRRLKRTLMCKIKKSVLADKLDDLLEQLVLDKHLTRHDKRILCHKIGRAIDCADLIPRGKIWTEITSKIVTKNCMKMRDSVPSGLKIPGAPEPKPEQPTLAYLQRRNKAA